MMLHVIMFCTVNVSFTVIFVHYSEFKELHWQRRLRRIQSLTIAFLQDKLK